MLPVDLQAACAGEAESDIKETYLSCSLQVAISGACVRVCASVCVYTSTE